MSDIKLFRIGDTVEEIKGTSMAVEKSLQQLIERHLEAFLGVRFLATEYSTGRTHGGRIDTLGIDENNCPVIIEYKRASNENVINQGLFYLDWLLDHKAEFWKLVFDRLGREAADEIDWSMPRLLCIAGDFTKYDLHAVQQINRNIELFRYKRYGEDLLLLELVNATTTKEGNGTGHHSVAPKKLGSHKTVTDFLVQADQELRDLYEALKAYLIALGDDVQEKVLQHYIAFKRIRNFCCVVVQPQKRVLSLTLKIDPDTVKLEEGFTRDIRGIGHLGTGDLEVLIGSMEDLEKAKPLLQRSYEGS